MATVQEIAARIAREDGGKNPRPEWPSRKDTGSTSWLPNRKVVSGAITGLVSLGAAYLAQHQGYELDAAGVATVTAFFTSLVAYLVPLPES